MRQKSRVKWLKDGDQSTQFFHIMVKGRVARHKISILHCNDGSITTDDLRIRAEILKFYKELLEKADPMSPLCTVEMLNPFYLCS